MKNPPVIVLLFAASILSALPWASAQEPSEPNASDQNDSLAQAQATLASLFAPGSKMPALPSIKGTLAIPPFDNSRLKIDKDVVDEARGRESVAGSEEHSPETASVQR